MTVEPPSKRQMRVIWLAVTGLSVATLVALLAALVWGLGHVLRILSPVLWPIAVAAVLALLLDPVVDYLQRKGLSRIRAIICVFVMALMIIVALFGSVVPQLIVETRQLISQVPSLLTKAEKRMANWIDHPPALLKRFLERGSPPPSNLSEHGTNELGSILDTNATVTVAAGTNVAVVAVTSTNAVVATTGVSSSLLFGGALGKESIQTATSWVAEKLPGAGKWLFGQVVRVASVFGFLVGLALVPVYSFYFLLEKDGIASRWKNYLPVADSQFKEELVFVLDAINGYVIAFFRGQVLVAIIDGFLYGVGFLIIGLPYAILLGVMSMILTIIPFLGAIITFVIALIIAVVQFGDWSHPLGVLAVFAVVQTLEGVVISPKILGDRVGLHPVTIIIAVMVGTTLLGGLLGGILAIPLTAALRVVMFRYIWKRPGEKSQGRA